MKRLHIHVAVDDLARAIPFYETLFATAPSVVKNDYAKWMLDDPFLNFSIDLHGEGTAGSAHFGIQVTCEEELEKMRARIDAAGLSREDQNDLVCGYQLQHKSWVTGPGGVMWEAFFTEGVAEGAGYGSKEMPPGWVRRCFADLHPRLIQAPPHTPLDPRGWGNRGVLGA